MSENIGYMVSPLGLTERQLLIFQKLYEKSNFKDMTVKYTAEQLSCDIRIVSIDSQAIGRDLKKLQKMGIINVIDQGRSGHPTTYKIQKLNEIYMKSNQKLKHSDINGLKGEGENCLKTNQKLNENPIKEKEKENNIYSHIFDFWNSKKIIIHKSLNDDIEKSIKKALKIYCEDEIIKAIDTYGDILTSNFYFNYKWSLKDFLNRKNGISTFMEDGSNKVNYKKWKENNKDEVKNSRGYAKGNNGRFTEGTEKINYRPSINTREYTDEEREAAGLI